MTKNTLGKIHSFQSLGAVDGPGVRFVVFTQGCPYGCPYCHNPDTRFFSGGESYTADEIVTKVKRYKTYFSNGGGVTVSGGEPLCQSKFVCELFEKLHKEGINTALDTAGMKPNAEVLEVLAHTDTVLCDIKFTTDELYEKYLGMKLETVLEFLSACKKQGCDIIIRHVVVPGLTDTPDEILEIKRLTLSVCTPKKIELLPFRKLCIEKYDKLGITFPLSDTPECSDELIGELRKYAQI